MNPNPDQPATATAMLNQAASLLASNPARAAEKAQEILQSFPSDPAATLLLGVARHRLGMVVEATEILQPLALAHPKWAPAHYELGVTLGSAGRAAEALESLRRAARLQPDIGEAWRLIADLLIEMGDPAGADRAYANHLAVSTRNPNLVAPAAALCEDRLADAEGLLVAHLQRNPLDAAAMHMLAEVAARVGRNEEAELVLARCLEVAPEFTTARSSHACVLHKLDRNVECLSELDKLLSADPGNPSYRSLKASALAAIGEYQRAIEEYAAVLSGYPANAKIWLDYGHALNTAGRRADCIAAYRRSIGLAPALGEAYWSLANLKTFRFSSDDMDAMRAQLSRPDLSDEDRLHFEFALGKALEDSGEFADSFAHYAEGNRVCRSGIKYDANDMTRYVRRNKDLFTTDFFRERQGWGSEARGPIFVVGLPRSGSTLIEQILSSHSAVEGTTELTYVAQLARSVFDSTRNTSSLFYPEVLASLAADDFRALGERYLRQTSIHRKSEAPFFIDKMPANWAHVGFIHLMLPNAKIVDARRHPLSCCFSNFKQYFGRGQHFAYDLVDLGRYYRDYVDLMAHFDAALPGRIHRVVYERMVDETEAEVRRLLDYCELSFEDSCLRFYETERAVRTPSAEQVRQPIFREGMDQWHRYEQWLGPVKEALGPVLETYPASPTP